ncbi:MAG: hypothetical protein M0011_11620 [Elusimicrobia bacterium]|nr:hypothetical protein [Elusimicrobiota bacterium]
MGAKTSAELRGEAAAAYNKFVSEKRPDQLRGLYDALFNLNAALREEMQAATAETVKILISKLQKGLAPAQDEMEFIRLWLIGDAEAYLSRENDLDNWLKELDRIMSEVAAGGAPANVRSAMGLRGTVTDALGLIPGVQRYYEAEDRVKRFEKSTASLDSATMLLISNLLESKIKSAND